MSDNLDLDLDACAREPIHIPGAIQPHGVLLVCEQSSQEVTHAAGDVTALLGADTWIGRSLGDLIGDEVASRIAQATNSSGATDYAGRLETAAGLTLDVTVHTSGGRLLVEFEPTGAVALPAAILLAQLEQAAASFQRAGNLKNLCERAAVEFRKITGFDRVMIYRFLENEAGAVLAEALAPGMPSFLNHHFPASDIPAQARALYVRNLVRAIPDVTYTPAPIEPAWTGPEPLDLSDSVLRSVSPVHMQYMRNMGVAASASISIVKDGMLWGLVACHHARPILMPYEVRAAARALAAALSRQITAKEDAGAYRERLRLRGLEDEVASRFAGLGGMEASLAEGVAELRLMLEADGAAAVHGDVVRCDGIHPPGAAIRELAAWVLKKGAEPFATDRLSEVFPPAAAYRAQASGLLAVVVNTTDPFVLMWFRAEQVEVVNWAGNPHKAMDVGPGEKLTPRSSFEAWREDVRGRSRRWSLAEADAAGRIASLLIEQRGQRRLRDLNERLSEAVGEKDGLLQQKEILLKEVNHRVQNSLNLVSSFLALQARAVDDPTVHTAFEEARRRLSAVALVHRRLYRADQIETVDLGRYLDDLIQDMRSAMGAEWAGQITLHAEPVLVPTDRAVTWGLVVTELVINANKYAYGGGPGPIDVRLVQQHGKIRLSVADNGGGKTRADEGFGSRMMSAMVRQLGGDIDYADNKPGLQAVVVAPATGG